MPRRAKTKPVSANQPKRVENLLAAQYSTLPLNTNNALADTYQEKSMTPPKQSNTLVDLGPAEPPKPAKPAEPAHWDLYYTLIIKTEQDLIKERVDKDLMGWPWNDCPQKLLTIGPFALNYSADGGMNTSPRFTLPQAKQESSLLLTKLFTNDVVSRILLELIFKHHSSAWKFWSTCQEVTIRYDHQINLWDMTGTPEHGGYFRNCEKDREGPNAPTDPYDQGAVSPIVVVAPFRRPGPPPSFHEQVTNLHTMSIAMSNFAENLQNIQIHRSHFLSTQLLTVLVPNMTNLKVLGIYNCHLLPVTEIIHLLEIIKTDRPRGRENQISLDFFPVWHQGPKYALENGDPNPYFAGTYGVTWDDSKMDSPRAVWAIVKRAIPIAKAQGIDLWSVGTAFRQWLDKGLLWRVEETLEAMLDPNTDLRKVAALVDSRNPDHGGNWRKFSADGPSYRGIRPEGLAPYIKLQRCHHCKTDLLGIFYRYHDLYEMKTFHNNSPSLANLACLGCQLRGTLVMEEDHNKKSKRLLTKAWFWNYQDNYHRGEFNTDDLPKALSDFHTRNIILKADRLDQRHEFHMSGNGGPNLQYDHEYDERQKPIPWQIYGRHGFQKRAPTADVAEKKGPLDQWTAHSMGNRNSHFRCH